MPGEAAGDGWRPGSRHVHGRTGWRSSHFRLQLHSAKESQQVAGGTPLCFSVSLFYQVKNNLIKLGAGGGVGKEAEGPRQMVLVEVYRGPGLSNVHKAAARKLSFYL